ncbi:nucleopolyhedrovirus P10 family protein [Streptomyces sp. NPDC058657]|uniref:nucleopolyhedrovirus P10 family protein n=1 Tax=unclassified Streptomyces TaxID=2593676 RepID=UPI00364A3459
MAPTAPDGGLTRAVRQRLALGRLLPLGSEGDGAWLAERAAQTVLRRACEGIGGAALGTLRVGPAAPDAPHGAPAVPAPPGALPPGPLCVRAEFEAAPEEPLPVTAERLRAALFAAAAERLGLAVTAVDLRVTGLLDGAPGRAGDAAPGRAQTEAAGHAPGGRAGVPGHAPGEVPEEPEEVALFGRSGGGRPEPGSGEGADLADEAARIAAAVPGVAGLTPVLGSRAVTYDGTALPRPHVRVELAVAGGRRAREVALAVRAALGDTLPGRPSVAVLVTDVRD